MIYRNNKFVICRNIKCIRNEAYSIAYSENKYKGTLKSSLYLGQLFNKISMRILTLNRLFCAD